MSIKYLNKAIEIAGSQTALAKAIGVKQPAISNWIKRNKRVPIQHVPKIVEAVRGGVTCHELRPDFFKK